MAKNIFIRLHKHQSYQDKKILICKDGNSYDNKYLSTGYDNRECVYLQKKTNAMDYTLNRIELRGNIGEDAKINRFGESCVARFKMATNYSYKDREGKAVIETTWHNIVAWEGRGMPDFASLTKGTTVYVCGRLRNSRFTSSDGEEKKIYEIIANRLQIVNPDELK